MLRVPASSISVRDAGAGAQYETAPENVRPARISPVLPRLSGCPMSLFCAEEGKATESPRDMTSAMVLLGTLRIVLRRSHNAASALLIPAQQLGRYAYMEHRHLHADMHTYIHAIYLGHLLLKPARMYPVPTYKGR